MRVRLKGLNSVTRKLADGSRATYWYAWKGGPRLRGQPGDAEFMADYNAAVVRKVQPPQGVVLSVLQGFQASSDWDDLAPRTRADYVKLIKVIEQRFGDFPLLPIFTVTRRPVLDCRRADEKCCFAFRQRSGKILLNSEGVEWTADGFRSSWRKACKAIGVVGLTFNDLRGTAVTRLALAGCEAPEIATITGHSLKDVNAILDSHYLNRDQRLGDSAITKLEKRTNSPNRAPRRDVPDGQHRKRNENKWLGSQSGANPSLSPFPNNRE